VSTNLANLLYLVTIVTFILALRFLSSPAHARRGNQIGAAGMLLAIVVTWIKIGTTSWWAIAIGMIVGGGFGAAAARKVRMTAMPQMVALFNGVGGGAAALISLAELHRILPEPGTPKVDIAVAIVLSALIGSISFSGSMIAFAKLQELIGGRPITYPAQQLGNGLVVLAAVASGIALIAGVQDEWLLWVLTAGKKHERGTHGLRRVMERAAHRQLFVVQAVRVDRRARVTRQAAEHDDGSAGPHELDGIRPGVLGARRLDHDVGAAPVPHLRAELLGERAPLLAAADDHGPAAGVGHARREHQSDRPGAEDRDRIAGSDPGALDAAQAARERLDHRRHLGRDAARHVVQVDRRDPLGHHEPLRVRTGEEREVAALLAAKATVAFAARRRVRGDDTPAVEQPTELVPVRRGRLGHQQGMAAPIRLQVGAVGQCDLDLDEHVARARLGTRDLCDPQIAGGIEQRRLHGVKTTLSVSPRR
jgi:hypothetical protein